MSEETNAGLPEEEFSKLMDGIGKLSPILENVIPLLGAPPKESVPAGKGGSAKKRESLLIALKPYLSPERGAAIDYVLRLARLGDLLRRTP